MEPGLALDNIFLRWKLPFLKIVSITYVQRGIGVHCIGGWQYFHSTGCRHPPPPPLDATKAGSNHLGHVKRPPPSPLG
jgi:hypothetical protein